jgi:UDP-N-acetylmuramyl tripeptide synthase
VLLGDELGGGSVELATRALGEIFFENALAAWVVAVAFGAPRDLAARAIAETPPPAGRFQVVAREPIVVVDYAHTPDALARTLETARALANGPVTAVFGAGGNRDREKRPALGAAAASVDRVVLTSDNPRDEDPADIAAAIRDGVPQSVLVELELDRAEAIRTAILGAGPRDVVVIAGKGHESTQTFGAETRAFSDVDIALRAVRERGGDAC